MITQPINHIGRFLTMAPNSHISLYQHAMNDGTHNIRRRPDRMGDIIRGPTVGGGPWKHGNGRSRREIEHPARQPLTPPPNPRHTKEKTTIPRRTDAANTKERWPERIDGAAAVGDGFGSTGIEEIEGLSEAHIPPSTAP